MINKEFFQKNFNKYHIIGCILCVLLSIVYWWLSGRNQPQIYKSNLALVIVWGLLVGWISSDFIFNARNRHNE